MEEHFYLRLPAAVSGDAAARPDGAAAGRGSWVRCAPPCCSGAACWSSGCTPPNERLYVATDTRLDGILFGCLLAVSGNPALDVLRLSERRLKALWLPLGFVALLGSLRRPLVRVPAYGQLHARRPGAVPDLHRRHPLPRLGRLPLAQRSPGSASSACCRSRCTCCTRPLCRSCTTGGAARPASRPPPLAASLALATAIYYGVERPCARLRKRLSHVRVRRSGAGSSGPGALPSVEDGRRRQARAESPATSWSTLVTQLLSWGLTFAVTYYLPGYVGDAGLGSLAFAASFATLFGVVVPLGTSTLLVKEIARDRARTGELILAALALRLPLAALMTGLAVLAVRLLGYPEQTRLLVLVSALGWSSARSATSSGPPCKGRKT